MLTLSPAEFGAWRSHFTRHPPDAVESLLSLLIRAQCAGGEEPLTDADLRPWRYTAEQAKALREEQGKVSEARRERKADAALTRFMAS